MMRAIWSSTIDETRLVLKQQAVELTLERSRKEDTFITLVASLLLKGRQAAIAEAPESRIPKTVSSANLRDVMAGFPYFIEYLLAAKMSPGSKK